MAIEEIKLSDIKLPYGGEVLKSMKTDWLEENPVALFPILIDKNNVLVDGHHRYLRAMKLQMLTIQAIRVDLDFEETKEYRHMDMWVKNMSVKLGKPKLYERFKLVASGFE